MMDDSKEVKQDSLKIKNRNTLFKMLPNSWFDFFSSYIQNNIFF